MTSAGVSSASISFFCDDYAGISLEGWGGVRGLEDREIIKSTTYTTNITIPQVLN